MQENNIPRDREESLVPPMEPLHNVKQYIIIRKNAKTKTGEPVSPQKLAVMTAHASMAFLSRKVMDGYYDGGSMMSMDDELLEWLQNSFVKVLLQAKSLHELEKTVQKAKEAGFLEGKDFFLIRDNCLTELLPDEGSDRCFIAIGFRPIAAERIAPVVKRLQLYR